MSDKIALIIYDLDGVLIDSNDAICESFNRVLENIGEKRLPDSKIRDMIGKPITEMFRLVLPTDRKYLTEYCTESYRAIYENLALESTKLLPGVTETLSIFRRAGLKQSLATTKQSAIAESILHHLAIREFFDLVLGADSVEQPKPSPEIIRKTLNELNVDREEAIYVEDTVIGIEAGKKAGVFTIGITTGTQTREQLLESEPDSIIEDIRELPMIVERLGSGIA